MAGSIVVSKARRDALVEFINSCADVGSWEKQVAINDANTCQDIDFMVVATTFCDTVKLPIPKEVKGE